MQPTTSLAEILAAGSALVTALGVLIVLWKALKITPREGRSLDADVMKKYEESLANQLERNEKLDAIIKKLEEEETSWRAERKELLSEVSDLRIQVGQLQTSVDRLSAQVVSMGAKPVI